MKKEKLSKFTAESLPIPFPNKDSVPRLAMFKSALSHSVAPANPERPLVDSIYSRSLIYSSDNYKSKGAVKLVDKIQKVINNIVTETCYIYYDYGTNQLEMEIIPLYEKYYKFGYGIKSQLENLEIGQESNEPIYTKYTDNIDPDDGGMAYGLNINTIYSCSKEVAEDSIIITKKASEKLAINYYEDIETLFYPEMNGLKDLYGYTDESGKYHYKPFPLPGEYVTREAVLTTSAIGNNFLSLNKDILDADNTKYVHKGSMVVDVEIYTNNPINNVFLENLRLIQKKYIQEINSKITRLKMTDYHLFSDNLKYKAGRYSSLVHDELRISSMNLKNKIYIKIKTINKRNVGVGDKLTNRDGGKGTVGKIIEEPLLAHLPDGSTMELDGILNVTGLVNRTNAGQLFEKELNSLNIFLQLYLRTSDDNTNTKYDNLLKWIKLSHCSEELYKALKKITNKKEVIDIFKEEYLSLKYEPYDSKFTFSKFHELRKFTSSLYDDTKALKITIGDRQLSTTHIPGKSFFMVLENGPIKDTSIRSDGITTIKGSLSKKGISRKRNQTKWGTTASKISDLGLSIMLNFFKPEDNVLLKNNINILEDYLQGLGVRFKLTKKGDNFE